MIYNLTKLKTKTGVEIDVETATIADAQSLWEFGVAVAQDFISQFFYV